MMILLSSKRKNLFAMDIIFGIGPQPTMMTLTRLKLSNWRRAAQPTVTHANPS